MNKYANMRVLSSMQEKFIKFFRTGFLLQHQHWSPPSTTRMRVTAAINDVPSKLAHAPQSSYTVVAILILSKLRHAKKDSNMRSSIQILRNLTFMLPIEPKGPLSISLIL